MELQFKATETQRGVGYLQFGFLVRFSTLEGRIMNVLTKLQEEKKVSVDASAPRDF